MEQNKLCCAYLGQKKKKLLYTLLPNVPFHDTVLFHLCFCRYALHTTLSYLGLFFRLYFLLTSSNPEPIHLPSPHSSKSLIHLDLQGIVFKRHKSQTVCVCSPDSKCRKLCRRKHLFPATEREIKTFSSFFRFLPSGWCSYFFHLPVCVKKQLCKVVSYLLSVLENYMPL